ncbi:glycosyltransferase family 4 protein [Microbacterium sp. 2MCAF23]|uniref:glycosyltransferase family 4 protein n=1 Tax=Microbacterium sp. 2MCAF23 TaxID=3232985 RepID=UPI003F95149D
MASKHKTRTIVFGVTIDYQLRYHDGLYQRLANDGWEVHLISEAGSIGERLSRYAGITVHELKMARNPSPLADLVALSRWVRLLRTVRPQVVVAGTPKAGLIGSLAARLCAVPVRIYEMHGLRLESAEGMLRQVLRLMERITSGAATKVVAVSPSLRLRAIEEGIVRSSKIEVLGAGSPNGVDIDHFAWAAQDTEIQARTRARFGVAPEVPVVLFIGRLTADKGLEALAEAMAAVERKREVQLLVVGGIDDASGQVGAERLRSSLSHVMFAGEVDDVAPYFSIADVFCLPSRREGLGVVILEAFAAGVPVVATAATGIKDLVKDGRTGRMVPIDDSHRLAEAILELTVDADLADRLAAEGGRLVRGEFSADVVQARWVTAICSACPPCARDSAS